MPKQVLKKITNTRHFETSLKKNSCKIYDQSEAIFSINLLSPFQKSSEDLNHQLPESITLLETELNKGKEKTQLCTCNSAIQPRVCHNFKCP